MSPRWPQTSPWRLRRVQQKYSPSLQKRDLQQQKNKCILKPPKMLPLKPPQMLPKATQMPPQSVRLNKLTAFTPSPKCPQTPPEASQNAPQGCPNVPQSVRLNKLTLLTPKRSPNAPQSVPKCIPKLPNAPRSVPKCSPKCPQSCLSGCFGIVWGIGGCRRQEEEG